MGEMIWGSKSTAPKQGHGALDYRDTCGGKSLADYDQGESSLLCGCHMLGHWVELTDLKHLG